MENYAIKNAADLIFSNPITDEVEMIIEYANTFGVTTTAETQYALDAGAKAVAFSEGKEGAITLSTQLADSSLFAMMLGAEVISVPGGEIHKKKLDEIKNNVITLDEVPKAGSVCVLLPGIRKILHSGESVTENTFTIADKVITFDPKHNAKAARVYYIKEGVNVNQITVYSNSTPRSYKLTAVTNSVGRTSGQPIMLDMYFPKVTPKVDMNLEFTTDSPAEFNIELDMLKDGADRLFVLTEEALEV